MNAVLPMAPGKVLYLESLRGLAALVVAIHHYNVGTVLSDNNFIGNGWLMVDFFFVLSGFVISLNYQQEIGSLRSLAIFQARRFLRLYPLHLLMLFVFLGIEIAKYVAQVHFAIVAAHPPFQENDAASFLYSLALLQSLVDDGAGWNGPSWSISAEFYTYLLFGVLVLCARQRRPLVVAGAALLSLAGLAYLARFGFTISILRCVFSFFLGVLAWNAAQVLPRNLHGSIAHASVVVVILALAVIEWPDWEAVTIVMPVAFALLILALAVSPPDIAIKRLLENRVLVHLGAISYGVYMIHAAVWWVMHQAIRLGTDAPQGLTSEGRSVILVSSPLLAGAGLVAGLALILWLAHLSYRKIEMPINDLRHALGTSAASNIRRKGR